MPACLDHADRLSLLQQTTMTNSPTTVEKAEVSKRVTRALSDVFYAEKGQYGEQTYRVHSAAALLDELRGCTTLALHATQSTPKPFAIVPETGPLAETICPQLSVEAVVEAGACGDTALGAHVAAIEVECGRQHTAQAGETAERLVSEFLHTTDARPGTDSPERTLPVYRLQQPIPKRTATAYEVLVPNFERVEKDTPYATIDGTPQLAEAAFYPVLMSATGYASQFGYAAALTDRLDPAADSPTTRRTDETDTPEAIR
jgi:hypothetical protein